MDRRLAWYSQPPSPWSTRPVDELICALDVAPDALVEPQQIINAVKQAFPALKKHVITKDEIERRLRILDARVDVNYFKPNHHWASTPALSLLQNLSAPASIVKHESAASAAKNQLVASSAENKIATPTAKSETAASAAENKIAVSIAKSETATPSHGQQDTEDAEDEKDSRGVKHGLAILHAVSADPPSAASNSASQASSTPGNENEMQKPAYLPSSSIGRNAIKSTIRRVPVPPVCNIASTGKGQKTSKVGLDELRRELEGIGDGLELSRAVKHGLAMQFPSPSLQQQQQQQQQQQRQESGCAAPRCSANSTLYERTANEKSLMPEPLSIRSSQDSSKKRNATVTATAAAAAAADDDDDGTLLDISTWKTVPPPSLPKKSLATARLFRHAS